MPSPPADSEMKKRSVVKARQMMRGHTGQVYEIVHLPGGRQIITCSEDGSLRLWDLQSGIQIGDEWRDAGDEAKVFTMALSLTGNTVASGSSDGIVRLWDVERQKITAKCIGHADAVWTACWSADGERMATGAEDGTVRVWDVESAETILGPIESGHEYVHTVIYSPDTTKIATGGFADSAVKIWDADTGELVFTIEHEYEVWSLVWTSDEKKLISGSGDDSIGIFDTDTWQQIATLEGHEGAVISMSLSRSDRLLASVSWDQTGRLWNLDANLPVGPPIQHEGDINSASILSDGKLLIAGCDDNDVRIWDIHTILKDAGLEDLLSIPDKVAAGKSLMDASATQHRVKLEHARRIPRGFFNDARDGVHSSVTPGTVPYSRSSARHHRVLTPSSVSRPHALFRRVSSLFRRSPAITNESMELPQRPSRSMSSQHSPHQAVEVAAVRDKQVYFAFFDCPSSILLVQALFVARLPERVSDMVKRIKNPTWRTRCILSICCVSIPQDTNDAQDTNNAQGTNNTQDTNNTQNTNGAQNTRDHRQSQRRDSRCVI